MNDKKTLKQHIAMIVRGYKIVFQICPRTLFWSIARGIVQALCPYFTLYMSALLVNELIYIQDTTRLLKYAAITVVGLFLINLFKNFIQITANLYFNELFFTNKSAFYINHQNKMQYAHLENPEISLLYNKISATENATGAGLIRLLYALPFMLSHITDIICSAALTFSLFSLSAEGSYTGFFAFINSPYSMLLLLILIIANTVISATLAKRETTEVSKAWEPLAHSNTVLMAYDEKKYSPDTPIFDMRKIILKEIYARSVKSDYIHKATNLNIKYGTANDILNVLMNLMLTLFVCAKAFIGVFGIGNFLIYRRSVTKFIDGVSGISSELAQLLHNNQYLERIFEYLDLPDDMYHGTLSVEKRSDNRYEIEFRNVSFKYPRSEEYTLKNINLKFTIGDKLAIVGMNGSGKTTFIKLLCRLYDPTEGEILLNGINIKKYQYEEYMNIFSVVFQDFKLFSFSIAENVAGSLEYDEEKILSCLSKAGLSERIAELDKGIHTYLNRDFERDGIDISGGEAQKIALARALYKDSPFIILDEPTASLDPIAEADIYARFNDIVEDKTTLYISHRLSSCRFCKNIVVFHNGNIVQHGSHDDLIENSDGKYYELWTAQSKYYQ